MPVPEKFLTRKVPFHPPEADAIADSIHAFLEKLTSEYLILQSDFKQGTSDWIGLRKEKFVAESEPRIPKLASFVEYLRSRERCYRVMQIEKDEQYPNPAYEAYMRSIR
jgi:hypothetical protein